MKRTVLMTCEQRCEQQVGLPDDIDRFSDRYLPLLLFIPMSAIFSYNRCKTIFSIEKLDNSCCIYENWKYHLRKSVDCSWYSQHYKIILLILVVCQGEKNSRNSEQIIQVCVVTPALCFKFMKKYSDICRVCKHELWHISLPYITRTWQSTLHSYQLEKPPQ